MSQKTAVQKKPFLLIFVVAFGIIAFLLISTTFKFKDSLFNSFYPKPDSKAAGSSAFDQLSRPDPTPLKFTRPNENFKKDEPVVNTIVGKVKEGVGGFGGLIKKSIQQVVNILT